MEQTGQINTLSYSQFRTSLYTSLLEYSIAAKLQQLRSQLGGKRAFLSTDLKIHFRVKMAEGNCVWCNYKVQYCKITREEGITKARRSRSGCKFCNVSLCQEGDCWLNWHNSYDN